MADDAGGEFDAGAVPPSFEGTVYTIEQLQNPRSRNRPEDGEQVILSQVVVSAGPNSQGVFHVTEKPVGPFSGIFVFNPRGANHVDTSGIEIGNLVTIEGIFQETVREDDPFGLGLNEVFITRLEKNGIAADPIPHPVVPEQIMSDAGGVGMAFRGVLVDIGPVVVTDPHLPGGMFAVNEQVLVGNLYHYHAAFQDQELGHLRGVVHMDNGKFVLMPRGFQDVGGDGSAVDVVTIRQLNDRNAEGHPDIGTVVRVQDVVVIAGPSMDRSFFHVQDPQGGAYRGLAVHNPEGRLPLSGIEPGAVVEVMGTYLEVPGGVDNILRSQTTLSLIDYSVTGQADIPDPDVVTMPQVAWGSFDTEIYEGTLIRLEAGEAAITVIEPPAPLAEECVGCFPVSIQDVPGQLILGAMYHLTAGAVPGLSFSSVTGVLHYLHFPSAGEPHQPQAGDYVLMPRGPDDLVLAP